MYHSLGFLTPHPPLITPHYYSPYTTHPSRNPYWPNSAATAGSLHYPGLLPLTPWSHPPVEPPTPPQQALLVDPSGKREELTAGKMCHVLQPMWFMCTKVTTFFFIFCLL